MEEYLREQLPVGALAALLSRSRIFTALTAATPGMRELLTIGKVWELAEQSAAPAAGGPTTSSCSTRRRPGMVWRCCRRRARSRRSRAWARSRGRARAIASFLGDPRRTAVLAVSSAEEMPVTETLELRAQLREQLALDLALIVVNAVVPHRFSAREQRTLRAAPPSPARHAALFSASWARHQRTQIATAAPGLHDVALVTLPFVFESALDRAALERLSRELDR